MKPDSVYAIIELHYKRQQFRLILAVLLPFMFIFIGLDGRGNSFSSS